VRYSFGLFFLIVVLSGCSSKQYFDPEETAGRVSSDDIFIDEYIRNYKPGRLVYLENDNLITKDQTIIKQIPENYNIINYSDGVLFVGFDNSLIIGDTNQTIELSAKVLSVAKKGNILALVLSDNSMVIYDIDQDELVFKEKHEHSYINNKKIASPVFMNQTVLFPTLDGKVSVVNLSKKKTLRNLIVATSGFVKNVVYLNVINNTLIAATNNNILTFGDQNLNLKEYEIVNIVSNKQFIYIATVDGQIIKLNHKLEEQNQKKYKFAKILTLAVGDKFVYALESQNYLIKLSKDFKSSTVYDIWFNEYEKTTYLGDRLYYDNRYLKLK
jgi:hypothetical protein